MNRLSAEKWRRLTLKNTEESVNIHFAGVRISNGEEDRTEFHTNGGFYIKDGSFYITYCESADMGKTRVLLKVSEKCVTVRRMGEFKSVMNCAEGETTDFCYRTPFGEMNMRINTSEINNALSENGGVLKLLYTLFAGDESIENSITVKVTKE